MTEMLMRGMTFESIKEIPVQIELRDPNKPDPEAFNKLPLRIKQWAYAAFDEDYEKAYLEIPKDWARDLARNAGSVQQDQILVTVPSLSIVDKWAKEGEIRLLNRETNGGFSVSYVRDIPDTIWREFVVALARARLKIRIFVHPGVSAEDKRNLANFCESYFARS